MRVYTYIVECSPNEAYEICKKYGFFNIESKEEMADCLEMIVAKGGESAFNDVMSLHPDREVLVELYAPKKEETPAPVKVEEPKQVSAVLSADGSVNPTGLANQTNTYILVAALIISFAIISMKK